MAWFIKYSDFTFFSVENLKLVLLLLIVVICFVLYSLSFVSFPNMYLEQPKFEELHRITVHYNQTNPRHKGHYLDLKDNKRLVNVHNTTKSLKFKLGTFGVETTGKIKTKSADNVGMGITYSATEKFNLNSETVGKEKTHNTSRKVESKSETDVMEATYISRGKLKSKSDIFDMSSRKVTPKPENFVIKTTYIASEKLKSKSDILGEKITQKMKSKTDDVVTETIMKSKTTSENSFLNNPSDQDMILKEKPRKTYKMDKFDNTSNLPKRKTDKYDYNTERNYYQLVLKNKSKKISDSSKSANKDAMKSHVSKSKSAVTIETKRLGNITDKHTSRKQISKSDTFGTQRTNKYENKGKDSYASLSVKKANLKTFVDDSRKLFTAQKRTTVNCMNLFKEHNKQSNDQEIDNNLRKDLLRSKITLYNTLKNCTNFIQKRSYITSSLSDEEEQFPIAYGLVVYKDIIQVERLLRAIYQPQNAYCIHVDVKSKSFFKRAINKLASCFDNVFIASRSTNVTWAAFSNLEPTLICMKDLLEVKGWKYFINLSGQEFPLKTNKEIIQILKSLNGANSVEIDQSDYSFRWENAGTPPHGIVPIKGSVYIAVNRQFVDFAINNKIANDFLQWTKKSMHPDEIYFNSLNFNPQLKIPGSYKGNITQLRKPLPFINRYVVWVTAVKTPCYGKWVRQICIFGVGDLPKFYNTTKLFVNKFHQFYQPLAFDCLEELIYNRTRDGYLHKTNFDTSYYENLDFVKNKIQ